MKRQNIPPPKQQVGNLPKPTQNGSTQVNQQFKQIKKNAETWVPSNLTKNPNPKRNRVGKQPLQRTVANLKTNKF